MSKSNAFTLAELLIALGILGVIATFTIPKVLSSQEESQFNAIVKEDAAAIAGAFDQLRLNGLMSSSTKDSDVIPYLNYVKLITTTTFIDHVYTMGALTCSNNNKCLRMHNGSMIYLDIDSTQMGGTGALNAIWFNIDPDGVYSGTTTGRGKSVQIWFYYSGRVTDLGSLASNTVNSSGGIYSANPGLMPPWFSW